MQRMVRRPGDRLFGMDCSCGSSRPFKVEAAAIVCMDCGRRLDCTPPILGVDEGACSCHDKRTFVFDATETYRCTACGQRRG